MGRILKIAKPAAFAAGVFGAYGAYAQLGVTGFESVNCSSEDLAYLFDSVAEACSTIGIQSYMDGDGDDGFVECEVCADSEYDDPPTLPPPHIVILPPIPGPGEHCHGSDCHADHVCGDDEIGGGDEDCEACPDREVPNPEGTVCEIACGQIAIDRVAKASLLSVPAEPMERGASVYCLQETVHIASWTPGKTCSVAYANRYADSCWSGGSKTDGCSLSRAHTHPFFAYPRDQDVLCMGHKIIRSRSDAIMYNLLGRNFSQGDKNNANSADVLGHLGLPPYTPPEGQPTPEYRDTVKALRRSGVVEEI